MNVWAIVPMERALRNEFPRMTRFRPEEKEKLALAMLEDVIVGLQEVDQLGRRITVPSCDPLALELANKLGAYPLEYGFTEKREGDLNYALERAAAHVSKRHAADAVLFVASDLPLLRLDPSRVDTLLKWDGNESSRLVILVTSRGGGVTCLYRRPPQAITHAFPSPALIGPSAAKHERVASRKGCPFRRFDSFILSADMDVENDLLDVLLLGRETRTYEVLMSLPYRFEGHRSDNRRLVLEPTHVA